MRIGLFFLVLLVFAMPLRAGEWKSRPYEDSIIGLQTGWNWTSPQNGKNWDKWNDNYSIHSFVSTWSLGEMPRISIRVMRMAPDYGSWYGRTEEGYRLDKDFLEFWTYLDNIGVNNIAPAQCKARDCITFTAGGKYICGAFTHWSGQLNDRNDTDLISGYYCSTQSVAVTVDKLNAIFASIEIRGDTGTLVKRSTYAGIEERQDEVSVLTESSLSIAPGPATEAQLELQPVRAALVKQETAYWTLIQDSNNVLMLDAYLQRYPEGVFAEIARLKRGKIAPLEAVAMIEQDRQETQVVLLETPSEPPIIIDKAMVENDDSLKAVIKTYFNKWKYLELRGLGRTMEMVELQKLLVQTVSESTFIVNITYRYDSNFTNKIGLATLEIKKTADSYKVINLDVKL